MKLAIAFSLLTAANLLAEDITVETSKTAAEAARDAQQKLETARKATRKLEETPITYGGFLVDLAHAEKKSRTLSLRQPVDPKKDYQNVSFDQRSARPKGFVLFSIGF